MLLAWVSDHQLKTVYKLSEQAFNISTQFPFILQYLTELKDKIECLTDRTVLQDRSHNPEFVEKFEKVRIHTDCVSHDCINSSSKSDLG